MPSIRILAALFAALSVATVASAHHSFAPHFDSKKPVSISGKVTEFEARNPHSYLHIAAVDENGRTQEYVCESHGFTQLSRNGITPQMLKPGTEVRIDGSQSRNDVHRCFFTDVYFPDGRALNVNGRTDAQAARPASMAARRDITGTWLLAPMPGRSTSGPQPMMRVPDGRRQGGRRQIQSLQGRPGVPLRSGRGPPRLGRAGHATVDHAREGSRDPAPRVDGRAAHRPPEPARASEGRTAHLAGPFDRPLRGRHARDRDRQLFGRRAQPVRGAAGPADARPAAFRCADLGRARCISTRRASGWWSRSR